MIISLIFVVNILTDFHLQEMRRRLAKEMGPGWLVQFIQKG